jgi:DNA-binding transcriptional regulator GbsR (MarR family)
MIEVVALLMFLKGDLKEHYYVPKGFSKCLEMKRKSERTANPERVRYSCAKVMAKMSEDGKHIIAIAKKD